jgi:hypothetical protein
MVNGVTLLFEEVTNNLVFIKGYYSGYLFQGSRDERAARQSIINGLNDV